MLKSENQNEELSVNDNVVSSNLEQENSSQITPNQLGKSQKIAVAVLAFFAFLVLVFWVGQFKKNINSPFEINSSSQGQSSQQILNTQEDTDADLKAKDTDGDGFSDWDELNIYKTSPFLEDSDSDGFNDKEEVENDKDPNCPSGRECYNTPLSDQNSSAVQSNDVGQEVNATDSQNTSETDVNRILSGQADPAAVRQLLFEAGMDKAVLDGISDADLMKFYEETLTDTTP